jgi:hypothetical protein
VFVIPCIIAGSYPLKNRFTEGVGNVPLFLTSRSTLIGDPVNSTGGGWSATKDITIPSEPVAVNAAVVGGWFFPRCVPKELQPEINSIAERIKTNVVGVSFLAMIFLFYRLFDGFYCFSV